VEVGFDMFKFRTMIDGADHRRYELLHLNEAADGLFEITHDPRGTRLRCVLRRTNLDELPQLFKCRRGPEGFSSARGHSHPRRTRSSRSTFVTDCCAGVLSLSGKQGLSRRHRTPADSAARP
jgi:hypothetical protein